MCAGCDRPEGLADDRHYLCVKDCADEERQYELHHPSSCELKEWIDDGVLNPAYKGKSYTYYDCPAQIEIESIGWDYALTGLWEETGITDTLKALEALEPGWYAVAYYWHPGPYEYPHDGEGGLEFLDKPARFGVVA